MKRMPFKLTSVLRHYERKKKQAEIDWVRELQALVRIDKEIQELDQRLTEVIEHLRERANATLTASSLIFCQREMDRLDRALTEARQRRAVQLAITAKCEGIKIQWAVSEESLATLKLQIAEWNKEQAERSDQMTVDEAVLGQWLKSQDGHDENR